MSENQILYVGITISCKSYNIRATIYLGDYSPVERVRYFFFYITKELTSEDPKIRVILRHHCGWSMIKETKTSSNSSKSHDLN